MLWIKRIRDVERNIASIVSRNSTMKMPAIFLIVTNGVVHLAENYVAARHAEERIKRTDQCNMLTIILCLFSLVRFWLSLFHFLIHFRHYDCVWIPGYFKSSFWSSWIRFLCFIRHAKRFWIVDCGCSDAQRAEADQ